LISFFDIKLKIKNPAEAKADNGATSIAMETVNCSNVDQSGYRLRQDVLQIMVVKKIIIRIFMGVCRRRIAGPGKIFENHRVGRKTCGASYWNGSRINHREEKLEIKNANHYVIVTPVGNN